LRSKYDVIIFPSVGGTSVSLLNGIPKVGSVAIPYKKSAITPSLGALDSSDDIRGGMGLDGMVDLAKFVNSGVTLITEGSTSTLFSDFGITNEVTVEHPSQLYVKGSILRGIIADKTSPIVYGYDGTKLPIYFNQGPVLHVRGVGDSSGGGGFGAGSVIPGVGYDITPNAVPEHQSPYTQDLTTSTAPTPPGEQISEAAAVQQMMRSSAWPPMTMPRHAS
jgi:hypothetical protein